MRKELKYLLFSLYGLLLYFTLFHHIGRQPIRTWDESLFACRALYMAENNSYMSNFIVLDEELLDHRNTKLPFTTWIQAASFKIFGLGEKALRIPIGLILLLSFFYSIYFSKREFQEPFYGILMSIILLTSIGFMRDHMARFGDHDVPFAAYSFLSVIFFYLYIENDKLKDLALFTFFSIAALLTKNLLSLAIIPGYIFYALYKKKLGVLLTQSSTYVAAFSLVASFTATVLFFENAFPGFFWRMWDYELFGRYQNTIDGHSGGFFYFFELLFSKHHFPWFVFVWTIPFIFLNKQNSKRMKDFSICILFCFLSYFIIVSLSSTKTAWYFAPLYMMNAYLMAMGMLSFYTMMLRLVEKNQLFKYSAISVLALTISFAFYNIMNKITYNPESFEKHEQYGLFLKQLEKDKPEIKSISILDNKFGANPVFYSQMYNVEKNYKTVYKRYGNVETGEVVLVCLDNMMDPIKREYQVTILDSFKYCRLMEIGIKK